MPSAPSSYGNSPRARDMDRRSAHFHDYLLDDPDLEPGPRSDPEAESVRSHPSSSHADQALLPRSPTLPSTPARAQTHRLQRRRNQYYYCNGLLVPVPAGATITTAQHHPGPPPQPGSGSDSDSGPRPATASHQNASPRRAKPYLTTSGSAPSWLLSSTGAFADARRQSWTGERRESRKLQKDHPAGSARPGFTVEIPADDDNEEGVPSSGEAAATPPPARDGGARGSVLGVRRRMEKLRGLYRRGEKETMVSSSLR
ncbi:unnamed protein product [Discula destructiva]